MFGDGFYKNSIFLFTRWSFDKKKELKRKNGKEKTIEGFIEEFQCVLNEHLRITVNKD